MPAAFSKSDGNLAKIIVTVFILAALICTDIVVTMSGQNGSQARGITIITAQGRIETKLDNILTTAEQIEKKIDLLRDRVK